MERIKEKKIRWQKLGGGTFRLKSVEGNTRRRGKKIKSNEIFTAYPSEIPMGFRDNIKALETLPPDPSEAPVDVVEPGYTVKHRSGGYYHVLDSNGKQVTEEALKKDEALARIKELTAE